MNELKNGEQPEVSEAETVCTDNEESAKKAEGSLGKFKDAESLLNAYNNLQAEFTRKCQKLGELEKDAAASEKEQQPVYLSEKWNEKVAAFLEKNQAAKEFSAEIANEVLGDPSLAGEDKALDIAFARVMSGKYKDPKTAASDEEFLQKYVLSSEKIRERVLKELLSEVKEAPLVMGGVTGSSIGRHTAPENVKSLAEAKKFLNDMFS